MRSTSRFLAVLPVVVFAAACSGVAPTGPSQVSNEPFEEVSGQASSILPSLLPPGCRDIAAVKVKMVPRPDNDRHVWLAADYIYKRSTSGICTVAPAWKASRRGLHAAAFEASIGQRTTVRTTVTATAPNGKFDSITF